MAYVRFEDAIPTAKDKISLAVADFEFQGNGEYSYEDSRSVVEKVLSLPGGGHSVTSCKTFGRYLRRLHFL